MRTFAVSTSDNPYNPLHNFEEWLAFDMEKQYNTINFLDRLTRTSEQFSDEENDLEIERGIDEMIKYDLIATETDGAVHYIKVVENDTGSPIAE